MSRKTSIARIAMFTAASALTMEARSGLAQIIAGPGSGPATNLSVNESPLGQFNIGPLTVTYDGNAGPIDKQLNDIEDRDGNGIINGADVSELTTSGGFQLDETIVVAGPAITDWEESILTPGLSWVTASASLAGVGAVPGLVTTVTPTNVAFNFDPLPAGSTLDIYKTIEVSSTAGLQALFPNLGQPVPSGTVDYGSFEVQEYPTSSVPEPASLSILGIGTAALTIRRRRAKT
jgi:hypothetical protein